jgi:hypothetical protein
MVSVTDAIATKPPLGSALAEGVRVLTADQQIVFNLYQKYVFPLDGMVYWVRVLAGTQAAETQLFPGLAAATLIDGECIQVVPGHLAAEAISGGCVVNPLSAIDQGLNEAETLYVSITGPCPAAESDGATALLPGKRFDFPAQPIDGVWVNTAHGGHKFTVMVAQAASATSGVPLTVSVHGSLHYASRIEQNEDATVDTNDVIFTSLSEVQPFNLVGPDQLYIGSYRDIRFAFSARGRYQDQADLYHYTGQALFSINLPLIIDDPANWQPTVIVSNSLPIWLGMNGYVPPWWDHFSCPLPLYPSYLVEDNLPPPFGAVHIHDTSVLQAAPLFDRQLSQSQLNRDRVRITLYGADSVMAETFLAFVLQYSVDWGWYGIANTPNIEDEKRVQSEFRFIAQKKTLEFDINYQQTTARDVARQLIEHAKVTLSPSTVV